MRKLTPIPYPLFLLLLSALTIAASFFAVAVVYAQTRVPTDDEVNSIAKQLYCPVCPNTPLDVCETQACKDWRAQIRDQLTAGWSEERIIDYFVNQYGERVLAEPQRKGFTSLVWVLPVIAVSLGLVIAGQILRSWRTQPVSDQPSPPSIPRVSADILAKIERELEEMD